VEGDRTLNPGRSDQGKSRMHEGGVDDSLGACDGRAFS
jgi:hypothetical protein